MVGSNKPPSARALETLRRAAGFRTATQAADEFGWPAATYRGHESGVREIPPGDAARYAEKFGVDARMILAPRRQDFRIHADRISRLEDERRAGPAFRLSVLRQLGGFESASGFARQWGLPRSSYVRHETGRVVAGAPAVRLYAAIHGVRLAWILGGTLPSGLGTDLDDRIAEVIRRPSEFVGLRRPIFFPDHEEIDRLRALVAVDGPSSGFQVREYDLDALELAGGDPSMIAASGVWTMPRAFSGTGLKSGDVIVVAVKTARPGMTAGERLFVRRGGVGSDGSRYLHYQDGRMGLSADRKGSGLGLVIGRVAAPLAEST